MPHQLRRVITINVRNPNGGLPSGRIAELDPRGGVLAVGDNGVGKTTFLRLLPLFYGATPTQILKGTGRSVMISYTLPDASSAVCYEYERESETDLRCVVMHARPNEEAPQFHIIHGGFREDFFYDESNQYVTREDFKARVEAMGFEVSRKLSLHQYRSVILNERLPTKEGVELRRLAAVHSLGPRALYNLDQIAAAMANEKINFRDLQNIVLERVSDASSAGTKPVNVRELKQNRESVVRWLEARAHLADILARKPDAIKMGQRISKIKGLHLELCTLHVAVKSAIGVASKELDDLRTREARERAAFKEMGDALQKDIDVTSAAKLEADKAHRELGANVATADARLMHFQKIDVEGLEHLQNQESDLRAQKVAKELEREQVEGVAGDASRKAGERRQAVEAACSAQIADVDDRLQVALKEFGARADELRDAQDDALDAMAKPARLLEISEEGLSIATRLGELRLQIEHATASPETLEDLRLADLEMTRLQEESETADSQSATAEQAAQRAKAASDECLAQVRHLEGEGKRLSDKLSDLQSTLTPPPGSLLEFIRSGDSSAWNEASKVIDPALLSRTDLNPAYLDELLDAAKMVPAGTVHVGPSALNMSNLETPGWVDMLAVRADIEQITQQAQQLAQELESKLTIAKRLSAEHQALDKALEAARAHASLAKAAWTTAKANKTRLVRVVEEETRERKSYATSERAGLLGKRDALQLEARQIEAGQEAAKLKVRQDFQTQRKRLSEEQVAAENRFATEKSNLTSRKEVDLAQIADDLSRELAGLGVDPKRMAALNTSIETLGAQLSSIASNRHEVDAWRTFRRETLPTLDVNRQELERLRLQCAALNTKLNDQQQALEKLQQKAITAISEIEAAKASREREIDRLNQLILHGLKDFQDYVPTRLHIDWSVPDLEDTIKSRKSELESNADDLQKEARTIRNELIKHAGGPADWLDLKERDLPDRQILLDHQYVCAQAQVLCDWFEPSECGPYIDQLNKEMLAFFNLAGEFVRVLDQFERRVTSFNSDLQKALKATERFERFRDLSVTVSSSVGQLGYIQVLRQMQDKGNRNPLAYRTVVRSEQDVPTDEDASLVRAFRDILQSDGGFKVNLNEQVRLECTLYENGIKRTISNEEEFRSVSSNGNTALITAMFLMGFVQMIRGDSPVRLTWVIDEVGRLDPTNLGAFLRTLDMHKIDVISACPSIDPALARYFPRLCIFDSNGSVFTSITQSERVQHEAA